VEVGIRELRADLSRWLKRVQQGEEVLITDRGKPIARIVQADGRSRLDELIAAGIVRAAPHRGPRRVPRPVQLYATVSDLVAEQRR
jgi:prevent-host-death family protein